jgi:hypothetical protein
MLGCALSYTASGAREVIYHLRLHNYTTYPEETAGSEDRSNVVGVFYALQQNNNTPLYIRDPSYEACWG